jgi:dTDP-4-dehydrorhamnose reductase
MTSIVEKRARMLGRIRQLPRTRFLITGGDGMLGNSFARMLQSYAPHCELRALGKSELDVTRAEQLSSHAEWIRGGWILHCAALVNVEECAKQPDLARDVIVEGTRHISALALGSGARVFYPQSFLIYDGQPHPIAEDQPPKPLSLYGQLKAEAERNILAADPASLVVRMAGFFGGESRDKNFVGKLIPHLAELMRKGEASFAVGDRLWQPTWTDDLALNSLGLIAQGKSGVYQMACHGEASFFDLTSAIVKELGWGPAIEIKKVPASQVNQHELGGRPSKAVLSCSRIQEEGMDIQRPWRDALREYLASAYFEQFRQLQPAGVRADPRAPRALSQQE